MSTGPSLVDDVAVVVDLADECDVCPITGLEVMGASAYLPLGKRGYDGNADTLTFGDTVDQPGRVVENGDLVVHWGTDRYGDIEAVGVVLKQASSYLEKLKPLI